MLFQGLRTKIVMIAVGILLTLILGLYLINQSLGGSIVRDYWLAVDHDLGVFNEETASVVDRQLLTNKLTDLIDKIPELETVVMRRGERVMISNDEIDNLPDMRGLSGIDKLNWYVINKHLLLSKLMFTGVEYDNRLLILRSDNKQVLEVSLNPALVNLKVAHLLILVWSVGLMFLIMLLLFCVYLLRLVNPIIRLRDGALAIATGDYDVRLDVDRQDEIGTIATFFNEVVRNLHSVASDLAIKEKMESELKLAEKIQTNLIPTKAPLMPGLVVVARTKAATKIGGDSFDFVEVDNANTLIYIGDVTGHGVPAALVMTMVNILVRAFAKIFRTTREVMVNVNKILYPRIDSNMFMTMVMLNWNSGTQKVGYSGAGHDPLLHYHAQTKQSEIIKTGGIALGMLPDNEKIIKQNELTLAEDDVMVLFTDGIIECRDASGELYGIERFQNALNLCAYKENVHDIFDYLTKDFSDFMGQDPEQLDDITMIVMKYKGINASETGKVYLGSKNKDVATKKDNKMWSWD